MITVSAPGKLMLIGEHAVVYGRPCLVTAIDQRMEVITQLLEEKIFRLEAPDVKITGYKKEISDLGKVDIPKGAKFAETAVFNFWDKYKIKNGVKITTKANFSSKFGFGSSSATVVGVVKALSELFGVKITNKELFDLCYKTILDVQGKGSGFDIAAAIYGGTLYFKTGGEIIDQLPTDGLVLVVGYSGIKADTVYTVNSVADKMKNYKTGIEKIFDNIAGLVEEGKQAITDKDWERLGTLMDYNQSYLEDLGVSSDKLNIMIDAAKKAGAYGAKLSGAGGGDCMIALVSAETESEVSKAITKAGGEIIEATANAEGVKIET